jgi:hypothetical protein
VGIHVYLAAATPTDFAFALHKVARAMDKPVEKNWSRVKRISLYL